MLAPVVPTAILCIGLNYRRHAAEGNAPIPKWPVLFMKSPAAVQNPGDPIVLPDIWRARRSTTSASWPWSSASSCKNVSRDKALDYVLGYTCANDVSARDWQKDFGGSQWCRGKTFDTFCPLGPCWSRADEIPNPNTLAIKTMLNGEVMQDWNTDDMIFDVPTLDRVS